MYHLLTKSSKIFDSFESEDGNKKLCERGSQKQVGPKPVRSASENNADGSYSYR